MFSMDGSSEPSVENQLHRTVSGRSSMRYNNKRCGCKFTANPLQNDKMELDKLQQQEKQCRSPDNFNNNTAGNSVRQLAVFCSRQKRAHAVMTPADSLADAVTEKTTTVITAVATTSRFISIVCNCENTNSNTIHITSSTGHQHSTTVTSTVDLHALSPAKCKISSISSSQSTAICSNCNSDCCDDCPQQHSEMLATAGDAVTTTATATTTQPDDSAKNRLALLLLLVWLLCLFLLLSFIVFVYAAIAAILRSSRRRSQARMCFDHRKCGGLLLCVLLCSQLASLAQGSLADSGRGQPLQGTSAASLGLQMALGTLATANDHRSMALDGNEPTKDGDTTRLGPSVADFEVRLPAATAPLLVDGSSIANFISRDHLLERTQGREASAPSSSAAHYSCHSCQMREKAKLENLESIKKHILMRLQLSKLPNITVPIQVPHKIIENFYKNFRGDGNAKRRNSRGGKFTNAAAIEPVAKQRTHERHFLAATADAETDDDMQGDDPYVYAAAKSAWRQKPGTSGGRAVVWEIGSSSTENLEHEQNYIFEEEEEEDEEEFYSHINSVYVFPKIPRMRHNRKAEILNFRLDNSYSAISHVVVHVYIRGREWMREHEPSLFLEPEGAVERRAYVVVTVHRAVRRKSSNSTSITHTAKLSETRHRIPSGLGQWIQIEVQQLANFWSSSRNSTQSLVIKGLDLWMRPFIVTGGDDASLSVFVEVFTKHERLGRQKRSTSLDCLESDNEMRCCRYPLSVNFTNFGWNWVVAPTSFNAYFCNGECKLGFLEKNTHTHLASLSTSAQPCCSPTKMSPLKLLYFNSEQSLVLSTIPNMSVDKCSCS